MTGALLTLLAVQGCLALQTLPRMATSTVRRSAAVFAAVPVADAAADPVANASDKERQALDTRIFSLNVAIVDTVKGAIDISYRNSPYARFYVLETVARVPYFAYVSCLHLAETFGAREIGLTERMRVHYAETDNELHHLLIMESLGGNSSAIDRTVAQTMAFFYYWYVVVVYALSPPVSPISPTHSHGA
jgi:ubiquinol oxidase